MSNISQRLDLRQSQNLVMTPQLQQAIKLLQLNNMELAAYIEAELAQNPLLEKADGPEQNADDSETAPPAPEKDEMQSEFDEVWTGNEKETAHDTALPDFDPGTAMASVGAGGNRSFDDPEFGIENTLTTQKTLRDHLSEQLHVAFDDPRDRMIGALLVDMLDESGYLRQNAAELEDRLGCKPERLARILGRLKQFEPTGVFARDLAECLSLQLEEQNRLDEPMRILLANLDLLAGHNFPALAKKCGVNDTYLQDMVAEIRALQPRPASTYDHIVAQTVVPDVLMKRIPKSMGGGWRVELNNDTLPRVLVNQTYYTQVLQKAHEKKDREYLSQQMNAASWLVKAMDQRAKTILKTAGEIVEEQDSFFLFGIEYLKPLTLKDIAEKIGMHESTVSRVTTGKYIGTPRGIFELKFFFSTALTNADGSVHSAESVKARIKALVDAESPENILSDDDIVEILDKEGIELARRTVAKYREGLHIPSSVLRKKQKRNPGA